MTVYNCECYLEESIKSILDQSFKNFEFIIINDGSTDSSSAILENFALLDQRISVIHNPKNLNTAHSLNIGIAAARAPFIVRMDADDVAYPERLQKQLNFMCTHPKVMVCGSALEVYEYPGHFWYPPIEHELIRVRMLFECPIYHPTVIMRRAFILNTTQLYDEYFEKSQDYDLWAKLSCSTNCFFYNMPEPLLRYRQNLTKNRIFHKQQQRRFAEYIRIRLLENLGLKDLNEEKLKYHAAFIKIPENINSNFMYKCSDWLNEISEANKKRKIYDSVALNNELKMRWKILCLRASYRLITAPKIYIDSQWGGLSLVSFFGVSRMVYRRFKKIVNDEKI